MITRKEAIRKYGSDYQIKKRIKEGSLYQIDKGLYSKSKYVPAVAVLCFKYPNAILTMESAFYYYGLTDVIPDIYNLATNRDAAKIKDKKVHQHFIPESFWDVGITEKDQDGYPIKIYSMERMLIELLRFQSKLPFDYYKEVLLNFRKRLPTMNMQDIQEYAMKSPNSNKVCERLQMEVL